MELLSPSHESDHDTSSAQASLVTEITEISVKGGTEGGIGGAGGAGVSGLGGANGRGEAYCPRAVPKIQPSATARGAHPTMVAVFAVSGCLVAVVGYLVAARGTRRVGTYYGLRRAQSE